MHLPRPLRRITINHAPKEELLMKDLHGQSEDTHEIAVNRERRRMLTLMAAGAGAVVFGGLSWARGSSGSDKATNAHSGSGERVRIVAFDDDGKRLGVREVPKVVKTEAEWRKQLSPEAYRITREAGTEPAFSGHYNKPAVPGIYRCICCGTALYNANTQYHSGTGWPSFWQPIARENITESTDHWLIVARTAISCKRCDAHLGHVFHDGPQPTGLRYCMDSVALRFAPASRA